MAFYVYITASKRNGTLYIGQTSNLVWRMTEHANGLQGGFTSKYGVDRLVWWRAYETRNEAFRAERAMKKWDRAWKPELIERFNPAWDDLSDQFDVNIRDIHPLQPKPLGPRFRGDDGSELVSP